MHQARRLWVLEPMYQGPEIAVWRFDIDGPLSADDLAILSSKEHARAGRLVQDLHRRRYQCAHVALRRLISSRTGRPAAMLEFNEGHLGKPYVCTDMPLYFNLSHSGGLAMIALSSRGEVGVDIEVATDLDSVHEMAEQNFSANEFANWAELPELQRKLTFYQVWTRKEACVKATGWGLHLPPSRVDVGLGHSKKKVGLALPDGSSTAVIVQSLSMEAGIFGAVAWLAS